MHLDKQAELQEAQLDHSYEARLERFLATVNRQLQPRIDALRLIGPVIPILCDKHLPLLKRGNWDFIVGACRFCNPPPKVYKCPKCDWETEDKWKMQSHNNSDPKWCRDRAARKVRKWAQHA